MSKWLTRKRHERLTVSVLLALGAFVSACNTDSISPGNVAWVKGLQAGIRFEHKLNPEQLMRHIPAPRPRVTPSFRRPGLKTDGDAGFGAAWHWRFPGATD